MMKEIHAISVVRWLNTRTFTATVSESDRMSERSNETVAEERLLSFSLLNWVMVAMAGYAWFATVKVMTRTGASELVQNIAGIISLAILIAGVYFGRKIPAYRVPKLLTSRHSLVYALLVGVGLRLMWVLLFPTVPTSDGAFYLQLAAQVARGEQMHIGALYAYWPPGYPLFLSPFVAVLNTAVTVPLTQILLFVVAAIGVYRLAALLLSAQAASYSVWLFALWPSLISSCATPEKEILVSACLVWAVWLTLRGTRPLLLLAGLAYGAACLVQPSTQLLIPAVAVFLLVRQRARAVPLIALLVLGAAIVIAPWTARNYEVFNTFRFISTNGGDNLYRANNPLATGGFTLRGEVDTSAMPELERDSIAKALAVTWMREHPGDFLRLALHKQVLFMGDDAYGVFATFRSQGDARNNVVYAIVKAISNGWWLCAWLIVAIRVVGGYRLGNAAVLVWAWLYLFGLHTVFEANGKYHAPVVWVLCIAVAALACASKRRVAAAVQRPAGLASEHA